MATNICRIILSRQNLSRQNFVAASILLSQQKRCFVATNTRVSPNFFRSRQWYKRGTSLSWSDSWSEKFTSRSRSDYKVSSLSRSDYTVTSSPLSDHKVWSFFLLAYKGKSLSRSDCKITNLSQSDYKGTRRFWSDYTDICLNAYYLQNISPVWRTELPHFRWGWEAGGTHTSVEQWIATVEDDFGGRDFTLDGREGCCEGGPWETD